MTRTELRSMSVQKAGNWLQARIRSHFKSYTDLLTYYPLVINCEVKVPEHLMSTSAHRIAMATSSMDVLMASSLPLQKVN
jgi:hypothetical protein